jgi:undecaprenyl-diphosphatase
LPVSSTFHLIFTSRLLALNNSDFLKMFEVVIQSGAIGALILLYTKTLLQDRRLLFQVIVSFIPTAVIGLALHEVIKNVFFETTWLMFSVFLGMGLLFILLEKWLKRSNRQLTKNCAALTIKQALFIGLAQACSIIPGVSRAGSVLVPMIILGYKREEAAKYTFLLSMPTIFAASALDLYQGKELLMTQGDNWILLGVGFVTALITAFFVVKWFIRYLESHTLEIFGWYRLIAGVSLLLTLKVLA